MISQGEIAIINYVAALRVFMGYILYRHISNIKPYGCSINVYFVVENFIANILNLVSTQYNFYIEMKFDMIGKYIHTYHSRFIPEGVARSISDIPRRHPRFTIISWL
jgi:hypothetical protein